jgi:hypothetical protein
VAQGDGYEAKRNGKQDVGAGQQPAPLASEDQRLQTERRDPPHKPTIKKVRTSRGVGKSPSGPVNLAKNPIASDPRMLIRMVAQGKASPVIVAIRIPIQ